MKKSIFFRSMFWLMVLTAMLANTRIASGQTGKEQTSQIPENINKVFQTSCMPCHGSKGGMMPASKLNFSKWADYGAEKEAKKASLICGELSKGLMPPKSVRKSNPELIPSKEQTELICKWAETLNPKVANQ